MTYLWQVDRDTHIETIYKSKYLSKVDTYYMTVGSDTTSATLAWTLLYLSKFPEVQKELQAEVESITGNFRPCSLTDRSK
jgi:hypothetical protein